MSHFTNIIHDSYGLFNLQFYGQTDCYACWNYEYLPGQIDGLLFHFVQKGKGFLRCNDICYPVEKDMVFIMYGNDKNFYQADDEDPWSYVWICVSGEYIDKLKEEMYARGVHVLHLEQPDKVNELLDILLQYIKSDKWHDELLYNGVISLLLYYVSKSDVQSSLDDGIANDSQIKRKQIYARMASDYILSNYQNDITVKEIANHIGIDRSYLSRIFKSQTGQTVKEYLLQCRIDKAKYYLENGTEPIKYIARTVGFTYEHYFSNMFREQVGVTPSEYRRRVRKPNIENTKSIDNKNSND